jgi:hypothetical protein
VKGGQVKENGMKVLLLAIVLLGCAGCTVKAVGDPNRPITINAHVTIDIKGLEKTASGIEDYVSGGK